MFFFWALHIPTGTRHKRDTSHLEDVTTWRQFYVMLDRFNGQSPGVWQYWSRTPDPEEVA